MGKRLKMRNWNCNFRTGTRQGLLIRAEGTNLGFGIGTWEMGHGNDDVMLTRQKKTIRDRRRLHAMLSIDH
jgi:hypothetical protein